MKKSVTELWNRPDELIILDEESKPTLTLKDLFSIQSDKYAAYRPHYPEELYNYLFKKVSKYTTAWDCGTGNGQVALQLARKFEHVYATDISQKQLDNAPKASNIHYKLLPAEQTDIPDNSVDLITVAQALHWFDPKKFMNEAKRVATGQAILAYWGYNLLSVSSAIDQIIKNFHDGIVGSYWAPERKILLDEYRACDLPLTNSQKVYFKHTVNWDLSQLRGYLESWSAVQQYINLHHHNPVDDIVEVLKGLWPDKQAVIFPVFLIHGGIY